VSSSGWWEMRSSAPAGKPISKAATARALPNANLPRDTAGSNRRAQIFWRARQLSIRIAARRCRCSQRSRAKWDADARKISTPPNEPLCDLYHTHRRIRPKMMFRTK
jgi:hypothetical protein